MSKYIIEGGVEKIPNEENNLCLITNEPLNDKFVKLSCDHKFNYIPLFLDIKNHKTKFNYMEGSSNRLTINEIRCPYCRKVQKSVLPYYEEFGLKKINGVNYVDSNYNAFGEYIHKPCQFLTPNSNFNPNDNNLTTYNDNVEFYVCTSLGSPINVYGGENYGDENCYCFTHKTKVVKKYKKVIIDKAKEEAKNKKKQEKEEAQNKKKQEKEEAQNKKELTENTVLCPIINVVGSVNQCVKILKSGPNKGTNCKSKSFQNNMCKRHYKLNII